MADDRFLEDFSLGEQTRSPEFTLGPDDLDAFAAVSGDRHPMHLAGGADEPVGHGPLGLARYFGTVYDEGSIAASVIALLDTRWSYRAPLRLGVPLHYTTTITQVRRTSAGDRGVVNRWVELRDDAGTVVQEGSSAVLLRARHHRAPDTDAVSHTPLSVRWARAVASRVENDEVFAASTGLFDGAIGVASENDAVVLRVYKGRVIDVGTRVPAGPTFTLRGTEVAWARLLTAPENDLLVRTHRGEFWGTGNTYVYLQLTAALHAIVDAARSLRTGQADPEGRSR
ncbi:hypothetical protein GCM10027445_25290 [Amycolatopsis endophytica]|uniref:Acyl dehydratase n=1 Tax=Amycolatopsis endophytica TaxID=860233 RepID=A0A853BB33_9PSEU|nr:hypothetical protein [Amycolatopsis endophytica]NYI92379.1 acyl dehydratase [Amycolatopsis endophytica]